MSDRREQEAEEPADKRAWQPWLAGAVVAAAMVAIYIHDPRLLLEYFQVLVWPVALASSGGGFATYFESRLARCRR